MNTERSVSQLGDDLTQESSEEEDDSPAKNVRRSIGLCNTSSGFADNLFPFRTVD